MEAIYDIWDFLASRRARITPEQAGLTIPGKGGRVRGLRREEVAMLADVPPDAYQQLECGNVRAVSGDDLTRIVRALQLDEAEATYLIDLTLAIAQGGSDDRRETVDQVRPSLQRIVDTMRTPAYVNNPQFDVLHMNPIVAALIEPITGADAMNHGLLNLARATFLVPAATSYFDDWEGFANKVVAILRMHATHDPGHRRTAELVALLQDRSSEFRHRWQTYSERYRLAGTRKLHHPLVGELCFTYEVMQLTGGPEQALVACDVDPATPSGEALRRLEESIGGVESPPTTTDPDPA
ncbi:MAG: helix-turn-helix transcriptional regulator [Acidimicrobiales bacterium]